MEEYVVVVQVALGTSLLQAARGIEDGEVAEYHTVADAILATTERLTAEATRRDAERNKAPRRNV